MIIFFPLLLCLLIAPASADMGKSHALGQQVAESAQRAVQDVAKGTSVSSVPGYVTDRPSQSSLNAATIGDAALTERQTSEAGKFLSSVAAERQKFTIDPETDPLLRNGNEVLKDPRTLVDVQLEAGAEDKGDTVTLLCEEAGESIEQTCHHTLSVEIKITPAYTTETWECGGYEAPVSSATRSNGDEHILYWEYRYHRPNSRECDPYRCRKNYKKHSHPEVITITKEEWADDCVRLEKLTDDGVCQYVDRVCSDGPSAKMIQDRPITKDCWQKRQTYRCQYPSKNTCSALRAKGCIQKASTCKERVGDICVVWEQTYVCQSSKKSLKNIKAGIGSPFCITGNCTDSSYKANGEMLEAMAKLSVFKEMQKDIRSGSFEIFKGTDKRCSRNCIDFKDCCQNMKGWGTSLHLVSCSEEERLLAELKSKKLCHQVGTYCAKRVLGICVSKKTSYCCFGSKLLRLLQEQGRAQLGMDWGEAENPSCRGLSPQELSRINFSRIDMSEIFEGLMASYRQPDVGALQKRAAENLKEDLSQIQAGAKKQPLKSGEGSGL